VEGDEVIVTKLQSGSPKFKGWVTEVKSNGIRVVDKAGLPIVAANASVKIIRSGRRNKQAMSMASITTNANPLSGLTNATYAKVLNAGSVELSEDWGTFCNCFDARDNGLPTKNPYVKGTRGNWRPVTSYTYLTERTQTNFNNNTNTRRDGVFASFSPYYFYHNGEWKINPSNWTFISEVNQFSPNGTALETKDALNRYSASLFSYKNTLTTAIAANSKLNQLAEGSFEDVDYVNCMDQGIFARPSSEDLSIAEAHSGRNSIRVASGGSVAFGEVDAECNAETSCSLSLSALSANTYQISGNIDAFSFNTISGSGSGSISGSVLTVTFSSSTYFEMTAEIEDKEVGCKILVKFFNTPNNLTQLNMQVLSVSQN
jgi:hypothetical protein